jgi:hypothetical protein
MAQAQTSTTKTAPAKAIVAPGPKAGVPEGGSTGAHRNVFVGADISHYVKGAAKTVSGNKTHDSGDAVATKYRGLAIDLVYADAAGILGVPVNELKNKYGKLNLGMQRMNLGNRVRAKLANPEGKPKKVKAEKPAATPTPAKQAAPAKVAAPAKTPAKPVSKPADKPAAKGKPAPAKK